MMIPNAGPSARRGNAYFQPTTATIGGTSWMEIVVSRNPIDVCKVRAVPTAWGGTTRVTMVENCALSAITATPQIRTSTVRSGRDRPKTSGVTSAQLPLTAIAPATNRAYPTRSAMAPPQMHPTAPTAIAANDNSDTVDAETFWSATLAARKSGIHTQYEYNSNMWP